MRMSVKVATLATAFAAGAYFPTAAPTQDYANRYDAATNVSNVTTYAVVPAWANALPKTMRKPCKTEDSANCFWDASQRGNKVGHSFIVRKFPKSHLVCVMYVNKSDAKRWDNCSK